HKKLHQKIRLLLANPTFQKDVNDIKKRFSTAIEQVSNARQKLDLAITNSEEKRLKILADSWLKKHLEVVRTPALHKKINGILTKYALSPKESWMGALSNFLLYGGSMIPLSGINQTITFPTPKEESDFESHMVNSLVGQNFGMVIEKERKETMLFVRIYDDTSLEDIKKGWKLIDEARRKVLSKKRFYPLKNLELAEKINKVDIKNPGMTDWEKQQEIFGEVSAQNWGEIETQRRRKVKQTRSRYKKRFKPKS
ncbi:MAG: hypothetical protein Q8Q17_01550, partial [bacterium]|nr:hypothetical protein [bacterium]